MENTALGLLLLGAVAAAVVVLARIISPSPEAAGTTDGSREPFLISSTGSGFHYCRRCREYREGSWLDCPRCGSKTVVGHAFRLSDGLSRVDDQFVFHLRAPPDRSTALIHLCGRGRLGEALWFVLEAEDGSETWHSIISRNVRMSGDAGEIAQVQLLTTELVGALGETRRFRANCTGAEIDEIEVSFLDPA